MATYIKNMNLCIVCAWITHIMLNLDKSWESILMKIVMGAQKCAYIQNIHVLTSYGLSISPLSKQII